MKHEVLEGIWRIREQLGAEENFDVHRMFERLRREQKAYADRLVQPPARYRKRYVMRALVKS